MSNNIHTINIVDRRSEYSFQRPEDYTFNSVWKKSHYDIVEIKEPIFPELPVLVDDMSVAFLLGMPNRIMWLRLLNKSSHIKSYKSVVKKENGKIKERIIHAPSFYYKQLSTMILNRILYPIDKYLPEYVCAFRAGFNHSSIAKRHVGYETQINLDLKNFFPSIRRHKVRQFFNLLGYNYKVSHILSELCTYNRELILGLPTSPALANNIFYWSGEPDILDYLKSFCEKTQNEFSYSRFCDDMIISFKNKLQREESQQVISDLTKIIKSMGFKVNNEKISVKNSIRTHNRGQQVLGMSVEVRCLKCSSNKITVLDVEKNSFKCNNCGHEFKKDYSVHIPTSKFLKIKAIVHNCYHHTINNECVKMGLTSERFIKVMDGKIARIGHCEGKESRRYISLMKKWSEAKLQHEILKKKEFPVEIRNWVLQEVN